jgi:polysaccharide export outer membrane protein
LPRTGPDDGAIKAAATDAVVKSGSTLGYEYAMVDVTRDTLPLITPDAANSFTTFGTSSDGVPPVRLGVGDVVQVTIFESQAGGLFIPAEAGARPGNFVELPEQEIGQSGLITVPYAGNIRAAGQSPVAVERTIVRRLKDRAIEPQVSIEVVEPNSARASVIGEVAAPGAFTLRNSGDRVLDLIAQAGGITTDPGSTFVTLTRGNGAAKVAYDVITGTPSENIFTVPGDQINVSSEDKAFYAFGATGSVGEFSYTESDYSLNKALAAVSGLNDDQADPAQVLIYREENAHKLAQMGLDLAQFENYSQQIPTIYRADFRRPDSFFMAKNFQIRDNDVIYVSNADSVTIAKVINTATGITGTPGTIEDSLDFDD